MTDAPNDEPRAFICATCFYVQLESPACTECGRALEPLDHENNDDLDEFDDPDEFEWSP